MAARQEIRTWYILGTPFPVVRTDEVAATDEGGYASTHGEIRISPDVPAHRFWSVEAHELAHAVAHEIGVVRMLRDVFGLSQETADKLEEEWIAKFLPVYLDTLQRSGVVVPPPAPVFTTPEEP